MSKYIFNNDAEILEFLEQLREKSIQIWAEGEKIRYRSKNGQLAPEILGTLKMAKGQILDFLRMVEKNVIPLTAIQTAYVVGQTAGCELGNVNAHYYIEYTIESLNVERLEQMINLVISKNDVLRLIVTHEGKASFLDNVPYYSVPIYSLYDENVREQKRLERSHHRYNYYKWPMFHFCVGKTSGKTSVLHIDFDCIILDAWSAKLLLDEIFSLYYGEDVKFPRISFMNYMRLKADKKDLKAEKYWKEKIKNMPNFPMLDYQKKFTEVQNIRFDRIEYDFSFAETQRLYEKIRNYHFTPAAVISTIFMKTLAQYSENPAFTINVTLFNRQLLHEKSNYYFRIGVRNRDKAEKMNLYKRDNVQLFEIDLDKSSSVNEFCDGANIIIGAIGPSTKYSEKMLKIALEMKIPYIDPGGMYLKNKYSNREIDITAIVGAGLFPGVSGWLLYSELKRRGGKQLIEIVIGGKYNFSRGAAIDYVEEIKENAAGVPMACIRNGNIVPASSMVPSNIISDVCGLAFLPYVTEEIQEIIYTNEALNIDAYTAVPKEMFTTLNKLYGKNEEIIKYLVKGNNSNQRGIIQFKRISENETKTIFIRGSNPGDLTGKILAISANAILYGKKKRGIFTMANYLSDYPLIDKLKGIKGFEYREEVQYA